jgi:hypothetical protein
MDRCTFPVKIAFPVYATLALQILEDLSHSTTSHLHTCGYEKVIDFFAARGSYTTWRARLVPSNLNRFHDSILKFVHAYLPLAHYNDYLHFERLYNAAFAPPLRLLLLITADVIFIRAQVRYLPRC